MSQFLSNSTVQESSKSFLNWNELTILTDVALEINTLYQKQLTLRQQAIREDVLKRLEGAFKDLKKAVPPGDSPLSPLLRRTAARFFSLYGACSSYQFEYDSKRPLLLALALLLEEQEQLLKATVLLKGLLSLSQSLQHAAELLGTFSISQSFQACQLNGISDVLTKMKKDVLIEKVKRLEGEKTFEALFALYWIRFDLPSLDFATAITLAEELMRDAKIPKPEYKWLVAQIKYYYCPINYVSGDVNGVCNKLDYLQEFLTFLGRNSDTPFCAEFKVKSHRRIEQALSQLDVYSADIQGNRWKERLDRYGKTRLERLQLRFDEIAKGVDCVLDFFEEGDRFYKNGLLNDGINLALEMRKEDPQYVLNGDLIEDWVSRLKRAVDAVEHNDPDQQKMIEEGGCNLIGYCKTLVSYGLAYGKFDLAEEGFKKARSISALIPQHLQASIAKLWLELGELQVELNRPQVLVQRKVVPIVLAVAKEFVVQIVLLAQARLLSSIGNLPKAQAERFGILDKSIVLLSLATLFTLEWKRHFGIHFEKPHFRRSGILHTIEQKAGKVAALAALVLLAIPAYFTLRNLPRLF